MRKGSLKSTRTSSALTVVGRLVEELLADKELLVRVQDDLPDRV